MLGHSVKKRKNIKLLETVNKWNRLPLKEPEPDPFSNRAARRYTVYQRSNFFYCMSNKSYHLYKVSYYIKWVETSWTYSYTLYKNGQDLLGMQYLMTDLRVKFLLTLYKSYTEIKSIKYNCQKTNYLFRLIWIKNINETFVNTPYS